MILILIKRNDWMNIFVSAQNQNLVRKKGIKSHIIEGTWDPHYMHSIPKHYEWKILLLRVMWANPCTTSHMHDIDHLLYISS